MTLEALFRFLKTIKDMKGDVKMKKGKWANLFGSALAGTTVAGVMISANKLAKKYGEKPVNTKLINIDAAKTIEYAINKFVNTDDDKLIKLASFIPSKKSVDNTETVEENVN